MSWLDWVRFAADVAMMLLVAEYVMVRRRLDRQMRISATLARMLDEERKRNETSPRDTGR